MNSIYPIATGMLLLAAVTTSFAGQAVPDRGPVPFDTFDSDGNGYVSEDEYTRVHQQRMRNRAADGRPHRRMNRTPDFAAIDADTDGRLSKDEILAHQRARHANRVSGNARGRGTYGGVQPGGDPP